MIDPEAPQFESTPAASSRVRYVYERVGTRAPVVTVVTPYYNAGPEFEETAACLRHQTLRAFEWIIVNDGSTDAASLARLEAYRGLGPHVRVVDLPENRGLSAARNAGFEAASAEFVFPLDADDLIEATCLEKMALFLKLTPAFGFVTSYVVGFGAQQYLSNRGFQYGEDFLRENQSTAMAMIRRDVWELVGGYDESNRGGLEDWGFWLACAEQGIWGATIPEHLLWYRRKEGQASRWSNWDQGRAQAQFARGLRAKFPRIYGTQDRPGEFPEIWPADAHLGPDTIGDPIPLENPTTSQCSERRLLLVVPWLTLGGADRFNLDLLAQLCARGWSVTLVTTRAENHDWIGEFASLTPDIIPLQHIARPADHPLCLRYLIESRRPNVVMISHSELGYRVLPYLRAHCPSPAYVDYCHIEEEDWRNGGYPAMSVCCGDALDLRIASSEHLKDWMLRRARSDRMPIEVCHINCDPDLWAPNSRVRSLVRSRLGISQDEPVILYPARLCAQKQPEVFLDVVEELVRRGAVFTALAVGDGELRCSFDCDIAARGLEDRVRVLGRVRPQAMREIMLAGDVLLLPSKWEGIALAVYEAMAAGLGVVAADVGGQRELVTPETGVLCRADADQVSAYADAVETMLADPEARAWMGNCARDRIRECFSLDAMGARMDELLSRIAYTNERAPAVSIDDANSIARRAIRELGYEGIPPAIPPHNDPMVYRRELEELVNSRAWRAMRLMTPSRLLRLIKASGTNGSGAGASQIEARAGDPVAQLARVKATRTYQFIASAKRSKVYRWYTELRVSR